MLTRDIVKKIGLFRRDNCLCADTGETLRETLAVLVGGVLEKAIVAAICMLARKLIYTNRNESTHEGLEVWNNVRRRLGGLEESLSADLALDAHGFLVLDDNVCQ